MDQPDIKSRVFTSILDELLYEKTNTFFVDIMSHDIGDIDGLPICVDAPMCNPPMINLERAGVTRIYYGKETSNISGICLRYSYGFGASKGAAGTDPRSFETRKMDDELKSIGICIMQQVKNVYGDIELSKHNIDTTDPNSCVVFFYYGKEFNNTTNSSKLGYHTDTGWSKKGIFQSHKNSQNQNSFSISYTLGDSRVISFRRRYLSGNKWKNDNKACRKFVLNDTSIFALHPHDEMTMTRGYTNIISQYQHGNIEV